MNVVLSFAQAFAAKQKEVQAASLRKNRNDDLIARYRPQKPKITVVDPSCDLRAMQEYADKPRLGLVHFRINEDDFPPPESC